MITAALLVFAAVRALPTSVPDVPAQYAPIGIAVAILICVAAWRRFRGGKVGEWAELISQLESRIKRLETTVDQRDAEIADLRNAMVQERFATSRQYDRAEMYRRVLVREHLAVPDE